MIYLACPYSHPDPQTKYLRFRACARISASLIRAGHIIFAPIVMSHPMTLPSDWEFWEKFDKEFLGVCEQLWVLKLQGWKESIGIKAEIKIMRELGKPIIYLNPEDYNENR